MGVSDLVKTSKNCTKNPQLATMYPTEGSDAPRLICTHTRTFIFELREKLREKCRRTYSKRVKRINQSQCIVTQHIINVDVGPRNQEETKLKSHATKWKSESQFRFWQQHNPQTSQVL